MKNKKITSREKGQVLAHLGPASRGRGWAEEDNEADVIICRLQEPLTFFSSLDHPRSFDNLVIVAGDTQFL